MNFSDFDLTPQWIRDLVERWNFLARWVRAGIIFVTGCLVGLLL